MNNMEIERGLRGHTGKQALFLGVLLADEVKSIPRHRKPVVCIVNTLPSYSKRKMGHWICLYYEPGMLVFLDSYALNPKIYSEYFKFNDHPGLSVYKNAFRLQGTRSDVCGAYAMYFAYNVSHLGVRETLEKICMEFSKTDYSRNDEHVMRFAYSKFLMPVCHQTFNTCP